MTTQAQVVKSLIELLSKQKNEEFVKLVNGVDMWGGSGAVWEVHIEDRRNTREFEIEMIKLRLYGRNKSVRNRNKTYSKNL